MSNDKGNKPNKPDTMENFIAMVTGNCERLTLAQCQDVVSAVTAIIDSKREAATAQLLKSMEAQAASLGLQLADVLQLRKPVTEVPKFRHPETGETWIGRGQPASWLQKISKDKRDAYLNPEWVKAHGSPEQRATLAKADAAPAAA
jgi:hypothetical protein